MATDAPVRKDAVTGALSASAALGGLTLVFLGVIIGGYRAFSGATSQGAVAPYRRAVIAVLIAFAGSLVCVALSLVWLATGGPSFLYAIVLVAFFAQLAGVLAVAIATTYVVMSE